MDISVNTNDVVAIMISKTRTIHVCPEINSRATDMRYKPVNNI